MLPVLLGAVVGAVGGAAISGAFKKDENFHNTKEVAELLGISEYTVRKKIREGELKAKVVPGKAGYRISDSDLADYKGRRKNFTPNDEQPTTKFGNLLEKFFEELSENPNAESANPEFMKSFIEGKQLDLKGLKLHLKRLELDADDSVEFQRKKIALEIAINDLEAEIQACQTVGIAIRDLNKNGEGK